MSKPIRILYVDDYPLDRELVRDALEKEHVGFELIEATSRQDFETKLAGGGFDLILSDFNILGFEGLQVLDAVHTKDSALPVIIVTGTGSEEVAAEAIKRGAADYIIKTPKHILHLPLTIHSVLEKKRLQEERQQAEKALRESEDRFKHFFEASNVGKSITRISGEIQVNQAFCKMLGYSDEELKDKKWQDISHPDDFDLTQREVDALLAGKKESARFTKRYLKKDGAVLWADVSTAIRRDASGKPMYFMTSAIDITERKETEDALKISGTLYQKMIENSPLGMHFYNLDNNDRLVFVGANPAANKLLGVDHSQFIGKTIEEAFPSLVPTEVPARYRDAAVKGLSWSTEQIAYGDKQITGAFDVKAFQTMPGKMVAVFANITERKKAEEELTKSHALLANLARLVPGVIYQYRLYPDGRSAFPYSSPGIYTIYEVTPEEVQQDATPVFSRLHPEDYDRVSSLILESARTLEEFYCEFRVILPYQGLRWRWSQAHPERTPDGGTLWHGIISDITDRKLAEDALRESEERFRTIYEHGPLGMATAGLITSQFFSANKALCEMLGYSEEELLKLSFSEITHPDQRLEDNQAVADLRDGKILSHHAEKRYLKKNGEVIWAGQTLTKITSADGVSSYTLAIIEDITERKQVEENLEVERILLRTLIDNLPDRIYVKDTLGRKTISNLADLSSSGVKKMEDMIGKTDLEVYPPDLAKSYWERDKLVIESGKPLINYEEPGFDNQGNPAWILTSKLPLRDTQQNIIGLVGVGRDITERKKVEDKIQQLNTELEERVELRTRELREAQEKLILQERLAVLGQLAGGVGHELRNPLGVINNSIYYLKMIQPDADVKIRQYHTMIEQEVHNAEKIITDLLGFARATTADKESVSITKIVDNVLLRFHAPSTVKVTLNLPAGLPKIFVDHQQIEQVLGNLVVNAYQAIGTAHTNSNKGVTAGGDLIISAKKVNDMVEIAVKDSGVGISPENMKRLFEPLYTTKLKGVGLGLAVSKKLVEANGGKIEVVSNLGKGSTFTVWLPVYNK